MSIVVNVVLAVSVPLFCGFLLFTESPVARKYIALFTALLAGYYVLLLRSLIGVLHCDDFISNLCRYNDQLGIFYLQGQLIVLCGCFIYTFLVFCRHWRE
ncbi:MAG: hypothetical protein Q8Q23_00550 [bacterium]|nr:hypothetical protein [bacterium]